MVSSVLVNRKITLKELREKLGFSQREFSEIIEMPIASLKRYELGMNTPKFTVAQIKKIAAMLKSQGYDISCLVE